MASQTQVERSKKVDKQQSEDLAALDAEIQAAQQKASSDTLDELDALLDEIDGLLEEQEVLVSFRQRGGE